MFSWRSRRIPTLYWWIPHHEIQQLRKNTPWAFKTLKITAGIKNTQNMQKWHLYMFTISFRDFIHKSSTSETQQLLCDWMNCKRDCNLMTRLLLIVNKWVSEWVIFTLLQVLTVLLAIILKSFDWQEVSMKRQSLHIKGYNNNNKRKEFETQCLHEHISSITWD